MVGDKLYACDFHFAIVRKDIGRDRRWVAQASVKVLFILSGFDNYQKI